MGSIELGVGTASDVTVTHWKMQWITLASSKREVDDLKYEERPNKGDYITDKRKREFMEGKLLFTMLITCQWSQCTCLLSSFQRSYGTFAFEKLLF